MQRTKEKAHEPVGINGTQTTCKLAIKTTAGAENKNPAQIFYAARHEETGGVQGAPVKKNPNQCSPKCGIISCWLQKGKCSQAEARKQRWRQGLNRAPCWRRPKNLLVSQCLSARNLDRKSTRLNSSHLVISYAVF